MEVYKEDSKCIKCGDNRADTKYKQIGILHRVCFTCKYEWDELPLDSEEKINEEDFPKVKKRVNWKLYEKVNNIVEQKFIDRWGISFDNFKKLLNRYENMKREFNENILDM